MHFENANVPGGNGTLRGDVPRQFVKDLATNDSLKRADG
jgi:hypothetical protein